MDTRRKPEYGPSVSNKDGWLWEKKHLRPPKWKLFSKFNQQIKDVLKVRNGRMLNNSHCGHLHIKKHFFKSQMHYCTVVATLIKISSGHGISKEIVTVKLQLCTYTRLSTQGTVRLRKVSRVRRSVSYIRYCTASDRQLKQRPRPFAAKHMRPIEKDDHHYSRKAI